MDIVKRIRRLMARYVERKKLDSQDLTEIAAYLLQKEGIEYVVMMGVVRVDGEERDLRYWLQLEETGHIVDFRCPASEEGVFLPRKDIVYIGEETTNVMINRFRFRTLTE